MLDGFDSLACDTCGTAAPLRLALGAGSEVRYTCPVCRTVTVVGTVGVDELRQFQRAMAEALGGFSLTRVAYHPRPEPGRWSGRAGGT